MKRVMNRQKTLNIILGLLAVVIVSALLFSFKEGLENPDSITVKCMEKGLKCKNDAMCCEGLKCMGDACK
jgi:hypothetical protein